MAATVFGGDRSRSQARLHLPDAPPAHRELEVYVHGSLTRVITATLAAGGATLSRAPAHDVEVLGGPLPGAFLSRESSGPPAVAVSDGSPLSAAYCHQLLGRRAVVGVIDVTEAVTCLVATLRLVAEGLSVRSELSSSLADALGGMPPRGLETLGLIRLGLTNAAIARRLGVSNSTVKRCIADLFGVFGVTSRAALVAAAGSVARPEPTEGVPAWH